MHRLGLTLGQHEPASYAGLTTTEEYTVQQGDATGRVIGVEEPLGVDGVGDAGRARNRLAPVHGVGRRRHPLHLARRLVDRPQVPGDGHGPDDRPSGVGRRTDDPPDRGRGAEVRLPGGRHRARVEGVVDARLLAVAHVEAAAGRREEVG